jgi:hypothetical protein
LITNISKIGISFLRNTFITFPFTRLFYHRIKPCIFDNLFSRGKLFNILNFSYKSIGKVLGNSLYRGDNISFFGRPFLNFFIKDSREFFNLVFKEKEFLDVGFNGSFSDIFSRGEVKKYIKDGFREGIGNFFKLWEDNTEAVKDFSLSLSKFFFEGLNGSCDNFNFFWNGTRSKEFRIFKGKEGKSEGIFRICFRGEVDSGRLGVEG